MLLKDKLVRKISKRKEMDERVVRLIADYPLKFVRDKMSNKADWRPIRIKYLGIFALKKKYWVDGVSPDYNVIKEIPRKVKQRKQPSVN